jgi:hypothetical protein
LKLIKNVKALSKLSIIILLIASLILGAFLSYLWVMGYYLTLTIKIPENTTLSISNVAFTNQNTSHFNVTFLNPSYSPSDFANITKIAVKTEDNKLHNITQTSPSLPYTLPKASNTESGEQKFKCTWNWANYTGQNIGVIAFIDIGSGPTYETKTPFVNLTITEANFTPSVSLTHFNLTVQNYLDSDTYVNISQISLPTEALELNETSPTLPYKLDTNQSVTFKCIWDWSDYHNKSITIAVNTTQGYVAYYNRTTPLPIQVEITDIIFSESHMNQFNVTVRNKVGSSAFVDVNRIIASLENGTKKEINSTITPDQLPYKLYQTYNKTFTFPLDWTHYRGKSITIYIYTKQNYQSYTAYYTKATPSPIKISEVFFDAAYTDRFNATVYNSALYYNSVNVTNIILTFENGTQYEIDGTTTSPQLPYTLNHGSSKPFRCPWNWTDYQGKNVTITIITAEYYIAEIVKVTPKRVILTITGISFDSINTTIFKVNVRNSNASLDYASISRVTITFENGTEKQVSIVSPPSHLVSPTSAVEFTCQWYWTNYRAKNITITVYAEKDYKVFSLYTTPSSQ